MKLFFIAGTQLPFPRMDEAVDRLLSNTELPVEIIYQSGQQENFNREKLKQYKLMTEEKFLKAMLDADLIVAHAGVGTLLECIENKKPVLMFPRLAKLKEHRNDHQLSTAKKIHEIFQIPYFLSVDELITAIQSGSEPLRGEQQYEKMKKNRRQLQKNLRNVINEVLMR